MEKDASLDDRKYNENNKECKPHQKKKVFS